MAKDKFTPIDPSIVDQPDDESSASTPSPEVTPVDNSNTEAAAATPAIQRTPAEQAQVADAVAAGQDGENRRKLILAAQAIKKKYPDSGDRQPEPGSPEFEILKQYEQEYGQQNVEQAQAQASVDSMPALLKPLYAAGQGVEKAIVNTGSALGVANQDSVDAINRQPTPGGNVGKITENVTQFVTGMAGAAAAMAEGGFAANPLKGGINTAITAGRAAIAGGLSGAAAQDFHEQNLSNLVEEHSSLLAPIADYMAAKPDDTEAVARTKKFFENTGLGVATDAFMAGLKLIKLGRAAKAGDKAAAAEVPKATEELQQVIQSKGTVGNIRPLPGKEAGFAAQDRGLISPQDAEKLRASVDSTVVQANGGTHLNFAHLPDNYDAKAMINEVSKVVAPAIEDGVQTHAVVQDVATMLGQKPEVLMGALAKDAVGAKEAAARVVAGKSLLVDLSQQITDQSRVINAAVKNGADTAAEEAKLLKLMNIHADLQVNLTGAIKGAARVTSAGNIDVKEAAQLFALADGNPTAVSKLVRPMAAGEKIAGVMNEWRVNCLLSGTTTLAKKSLTDALMAVYMPTSQMIGGAFHANIPEMKQGAATFVGLMKGVGDAFAMARMALNHETQFLTAGGAGAIENPRHFIQSNQGGFVGTLVNALGSTVRMPTRLIGTLDEFSKQLNYRGAVYAQATREGAEKGLTGANLASWVEDYTAKAFDSEGRGINPQALQYAKEATFTQDLDYGLGKWLQDGANKHPVVRAIVPFIKVPTNLFRKAVQFTPGLQWLDQGFRDAMEAGGSRAARARGTQVMGAAMYAQAVNLATSGRITGGGPRDPQARQALLATGWQPYSFKIGDRYVSYHAIEPFGTVFGLVGDFTEACGQLSGDSADQAAAAMTLALAHNLTSKTYYAGVVQTLDALQGDPAKAQKLLQSFTGSFVPNARQFTDIMPQTQDPYMRECRSILDGMKKKIPGLSDTLPPRRNIFGEPIQTPAAFGPDSLSPFHTSQGTNDALLNELAKFPKGFSLPSKKDGNVDLTQIPSKEGGYDAYDRLLQLNGSVRVGGKNLKDRLNEAIQSDKYKNLTDDGPGYSGSKFEYLSGIIGGYRSEALSALRKENEGLRKAVRGDLENKKAALTKGPDAINPLQNLMSTLQPH